MTEHVPKGKSAFICRKRLSDKYANVHFLFFFFLFFCCEQDVLLFSLFVHELSRCRNGNSNDYGSSRKFQINPFVIPHRFFQPVRISSTRFYIISTFLNPGILLSLISLTFSTKILSVEYFFFSSSRMDPCRNISVTSFQHTQRTAFSLC